MYGTFNAVLNFLLTYFYNKTMASVAGSIIDTP